jgi:hypothetical protein
MIKETMHLIKEMDSSNLNETSLNQKKGARRKRVYFCGYGRLHANYAETNYLKPFSDKGVLLMLAFVIARK